MKANRKSSYPILDSLERRRLMTIYNVTNVLDSGAGSFRQALIDATAHTGNTIQFKISSGPMTINLLSALPTVTNSVVIDATTLTQYTGTPLIELDGSAVTAGYGLWLKATNVTVRGLVIHSFGLGPSGKSAIRIDNGSDTIQNCYLGTSANGFSSLPDGFSGIEAGAGGNLIGGTGLHDGNVISGNASAGIFLVNSANNTIQGNYIGVGADGSTPLPNGTNGISCVFNDPGNIIGGTATGARNVIANNYDGIYLSFNSGGATIQGNYLGTDAHGTIALPNLNAGIECQAPNVTIGGTVAGAGNLISGNQIGIMLDTSNCTGAIVRGNTIGTDAAGQLPIKNVLGITLGNLTHGNTIGGTTPAARNLISGNTTNVACYTGANENTFQGNFIGTDTTGLAPLPTLGDPDANGTGILLQAPNIVNNVIGGPLAGAGNVIAGNQSDGIRLESAGTNTIQNNFIGVLAADGITQVGNGGNGIKLLTYGGATQPPIGNFIDGNSIRFNALSGVLVMAGTGNQIVANQIAGNQGLGIDLGGSGVPVPNDAGDPDTGPNNFQNFPVLSSFTGSVVNGTLNSIGSTAYSVNFYWSASLDPAANSQGEFWLGSVSASTAASGNASFSFTPGAYLAGGFLSATATDPAGNTSEFSAALAIPDAGLTNLYLKKDADGTHADVWINGASPGTGTPNRKWLLGQGAPFTFGGSGGNDRLTLDFSAGSPLPAAGIKYDGAAGDNATAFVGTTSADTLAASAFGLTFGGGAGGALFAGVPVETANAPSVIFHGNAGVADAINLASGTFTIDADTPTGTPNISVAVAALATANFAIDQHLAGLSIADGGVNFSATRHTMNLHTLSISGGGLLDIGNCFLYIDNTYSNLAAGGTQASANGTPYAVIQQYVNNVYNLNGPGNPNPGVIGDYQGRGGIGSAVAKNSYAGGSVGKVSLVSYSGAQQDGRNPLGIGGLVLGPNSNSGNGTGIPFSKTLIRPTHTGDLNGDGVVDDFDITLFSAYGLYKGNGAGPQTLLGPQVGDFNNSLAVEDNDILIFSAAGNYLNGSYPVVGVAARSLVSAPTPAALSWHGQPAHGRGIPRRWPVLRPMKKERSDLLQ